jgi:hypothetical protein
VAGSPMGNEYTKNMSSKKKEGVLNSAVSMLDVFAEIINILKNKYKSGDRIKVNKSNI